MRALLNVFMLHLHSCFLIEDRDQILVLGKLFYEAGTVDKMKCISSSFATEVSSRVSFALLPLLDIVEVCLYTWEWSG